MLAVTELLNGGAGGSAGDFPAGANAFRQGTYLNRGVELTGNVNSRVCTLSFWLKYGTWGDNETICEFPGGWNPCLIDTDDTVRFYPNNPAGDINPIALRTGALPRDFRWHHIVFAFDLTTSTRMVFLDGVDVTVVITAPTNTDIGWTGRNAFIIGRRYDTDTNYLYASLAEFYFNPKEFVDVRIPANMAKFRNAAGKPVNLGPDGSWVTGNPPIVYLRHDPGAPITDFLHNRGSGGDYSGGAWAIAGNLWNDPVVPSSFWNQVFGSVVFGTNAGWAGFTVRQRIPKANINRVPAGQSQVRVTVASDPSGSPYTFDKMHIGHQGGEAWDATDLTQLFFSGAPGATVAGNSFLTSDAANWKYNGTSDVLLTAHSTSAGAAGYGYNQGTTNYFKAAIDEAAVLNVSSYSASTTGLTIFFNSIEML